MKYKTLATNTVDIFSIKYISSIFTNSLAHICGGLNRKVNYTDGILAI